MKYIYNDIYIYIYTYLSLCIDTYMWVCPLSGNIPGTVITFTVCDSGRATNTHWKTRHISTAFDPERKDSGKSGRWKICEMAEAAKCF